MDTFPSAMGSNGRNRDERTVLPLAACELRSTWKTSRGAVALPTAKQLRAMSNQLAREHVTRRRSRTGESCCGPSAESSRAILASLRDSTPALWRVGCGRSIHTAAGVMPEATYASHAWTASAMPHNRRSKSTRQSFVTLVVALDGTTREDLVDVLRRQFSSERRTSVDPSGSGRPRPQ